MKDLTKTAKILDNICRILAVAVSIASVCMIVGLCILAAGALFDLPPEMVGTGYATVDLGVVSLTVADAYLPDYRTVWLEIAAELLLAFVCLIPARLILKSLRAILAPMKNGEPFHNTVSEQLSRIARYVCFLGFGWNLANIAGSILMIKAFDLHLLLLSEKVPHVEFFFSFDLSFLFVCGILLLLSYVFRYGEQLQQLSDETL